MSVAVRHCSVLCRPPALADSGLRLGSAAMPSLQQTLAAADSNGSFRHYSSLNQRNNFLFLKTPPAPIYSGGRRGLGWIPTVIRSVLKIRLASKVVNKDT